MSSHPKRHGEQTPMPDELEMDRLRNENAALRSDADKWRELYDSARQSEREACIATLEAVPELRLLDRVRARCLAALKARPA